MKITAIYSSKGGVGKTAAAVNLAYVSATSGKKTLLCDMDTQGAAGFYLRIRPKGKFSRKKLLQGKISSYIRGTDYENLDLLPAHFSYRNLDLALQNQENQAGHLQEILAPLAGEYDRVFLDCPPNLTLLSENIIKAADLVVSPVIPTTLSLLALEQLLKFFKKIKADRRKLKGFFSMVDKRKRMHRLIMEELYHKPLFLKEFIPFLADVEKMGIHRQPVGVSTPKSVAAEAYRNLFLEI